MQDTRLTKLVDIRYPIVQAPIGSATTPELAAAVSNAGALGSLSIAWRNPQALLRDIQRTAQLTQRPFAVNVVLAWPQEERVSLALQAGARIVWTFWGDPAPYAARIHDSGALHLHSIGSLEEAESAAEAGVDVLVAQGIEAGGHVRGVSPWRGLLSAIIDRTSDLPVLVAGGMANGADIAEALLAGADGAVLGTRFLCAVEADVAPIYRQRILEASSADTVLTDLFDKGWPNARHRVLRNSTVRRWEDADCPAPGSRPGEHDQIAWTSDGKPVERYSDVIPTRRMKGDLEALALYAGQGCDRIREVAPAAEVVARLVKEMLATHPSVDSSGSQGQVK